MFLEPGKFAVLRFDELEAEGAIEIGFVFGGKDGGGAEADAAFEAAIGVPMEGVEIGALGEPDVVIFRAGAAEEAGGEVFGLGEPEVELAFGELNEELFERTARRSVPTWIASGDEVGGAEFGGGGVALGDVVLEEVLPVLMGRYRAVNPDLLLAGSSQTFSNCSQTGRGFTPRIQSLRLFVTGPGRIGVTGGGEDVTQLILSQGEIGTQPNRCP